MAGDEGSKDDPHYHGHRARLRERFLKQGADGLPDYELLELLLATAIPRRDVKPLAKTLLAKYGGFAEVLSADANVLMKEKGVGEGAAVSLKVVQAAALRLLADKIKDRPILDAWSKLLDYCYASMAHERTEQFRILFLDTRNRLIQDEVQQQGTVNHTPVYPREVVKRGIELGASALIIIHNHPSGDPTPSDMDIEMTRQVGEAAKAVGLILHDHIIVGRDGYVSFKSKGLM